MAERWPRQRRQSDGAAVAVAKMRRGSPGNEREVDGGNTHDNGIRQLK